MQWKPLVSNEVRPTISTLEATPVSKYESSGSSKEKQSYINRVCCLNRTQFGKCGDPDPIKLPASHLSAHIPFRIACGLFDARSRDWNEEFQQLWAEYCRQILGADYRDQLENFLHEFESRSKELVERLIREGKDSPFWSARALSFPDCYRCGNIFIRIWRDNKLGQNIQKCFRALLCSRSPYISFPLTATFRFLNLSISTQAIIPIESGRIATYRGDGEPDSIIHRPLLEYLNYLCEALNNVPEGSDILQKRLCVEVYESPDTRLYILNPLGLIPPLAAGHGRTPPLRRWEHIVLNPAVCCYPTLMNFYMKELNSIHEVLFLALQEPPSKRNKVVVQIMHEKGLNVRFLAIIAYNLLAIPDTERSDLTEGLLKVVCIEIVTRALRHIMLNQIALDKAKRTPRVLTTYLVRTVASMADVDAAQLAVGLAPKIQDLFFLNGKNLNILMPTLQGTFQDCPVLLIKRLCQLCGLILKNGIVESIECQNSSHNYTSLFRLQNDGIINELSKDTSKDAFLSRNVVMSFVYPFRIDYYIRSGRRLEALSCAKTLVEYRCESLHLRFIYAESLCIYAVVASYCNLKQSAKAVIGRAVELLKSTPVYETWHGTLDRKGRLPKNIYLSRAQIVAILIQGYIYLYLSDYEASKEIFNRAYLITESMDERQREFGSQLKLLAIRGLLELATRYETNSVPEIGALLAKTKIRPSIFAAQVFERFADLLLDSNRHEQAVSRLQGCLEITSMLLGEDSHEAGVLYNKLAFVYYTWDAHRYGVYSNVMLELGEKIMIETRGRYSVFHLGVVLNKVALLIMRGRYVRASQQLQSIANLPARFTAKIPKDHHIFQQIKEMGAKLQALFRPYATLIIQRYWREYKRCLSHLKLYELKVTELQRIGRGFLSRTRLCRYQFGEISIAKMRGMETLSIILNFSKPLIKASEMMSREERNWNGEYQFVKRALWWDEALAALRESRFYAIEKDFRQKALQYVEMLENSEDNLTRVQDCTTSYVAGNMVITRVSKNDPFSHILDKLFQHFRKMPFHMITSTMSCVIEREKNDFFAQALIPVHRKPQFAFNSDGREGKNISAAKHEVAEEVLHYFRSRGFFKSCAQGFEILISTDEMWYITNALGVVYNTAKYELSPMNDIGVSFVQVHTQMIFNNEPQKAIALIEQYLLNYKFLHPVGNCVFQAYLAYSYCAQGEVTEEVTKIFQRVTDTLEEYQFYFLASLIHYYYGFALLRSHEPVLSMEAFTVSYRLLQKLCLHVYYGSRYILECARCILMACNSSDQRIKKELIEEIIQLVQVGEMNELTFEVCGTYSDYCIRIGDARTAKIFLSIATSRAKCLSKELCRAYVNALVYRSKFLFKRGGDHHYQGSASSLKIAIRIMEVSHPYSMELGTMYNDYGSLMLYLNNTAAAKQYLSQAQCILSRYADLDQPVMVSFNKNMKILERRLRIQAATTIQRFARGWIERRRTERRVEAEYPKEYGQIRLMKITRQIKCVVIAEAASRVRVADEENEAVYSILKEQRKMFSRAKLATLLRETYDLRVGIEMSKYEFAMEAVRELEQSIRTAAYHFECKCRKNILIGMISEQHRIMRRRLIRESHCARIELKLWHTENASVIDHKIFFKAYIHLMLKFVCKEEQINRQRIDAEARKSKSDLGKCIVTILKTRRSMSRLLLRLMDDLKLKEEVQRNAFCGEETEEFLKIISNFNFGPIVNTDSETETEMNRM